MEKTIKYLENGEYHYATVRSVGDLAQLKTDSKETLVEAINELWNGGGNADPSKAPKPEGYDQLVEDVADAVKNQQEISQQWIEWQKEDTQLTEERKQAYLQAMKEMQESIDKAKADAATLDDKTAKLDEQITKTFSDLDTNIQNMHEQLQKEADRMNQELQDTKGALSTLRTDLQNAQLDNGKIHDELTNINGKFEHKVWQTDLDPLKAQIDRAETSVQQTKDELLGKASREDLDTVTNAVSKLDTQLKETAKGVEISVKKDELGGDVARLLNDKTNLLLGTRNFSGSNWLNREYWHEEPGYWNGLKVYSSEQQYYGIQYQYYVKAGNTYTFSLWAKQDVENLQAAFYLLAENKEGIVDPLKQENVIVKTEWTRVHITFDALQDAFIYPRLEQTVVKNKLYVAGYKLELGKNATPWEPNEADVAENIEHTESQFNVYSDQIAGIVKKQEKMGDTERQLDTRITETAEGLKQTSKDLQDANGKITEFKGQLESTAHGLKTEYEKYTNDAVGQISDSTLNLIRNSSFQNKDEDFAQWQNVSAKANVRQDENGLRWVELTQSGMTTDNPQGLTSNYFNVKQGKVTIAVDIKSGDKATLDNESVLFLELYNDAKKRVDFRFITLSELGLSNSLLGDHQVHRGLYRLGIDRNDAKYMTVKAHLMRNGDLYFTNFSARLSSIDDGAYEPNPDDINQQILKQNTKIEQNAKEVAIKANSVDVTRDIKSAVDGIQVGGVNLIKNSETDIVIESKTTDAWPAWKYKVVYYDLTPGETYTFSVSATNTNNVKDASIRIFNEAQNKEAPGNLVFPADGKRHSTTFTLPKDEVNYSVYLYAGHMGNIEGKDFVTTYHHPQLELGNKSTSWSPAPEDTSAEIKSVKDAAIQVASGQINLRVNELSTQFDDRLNKRINEQKTASEKFTSDGIEQVVTKIKNVKGDVDRLGDTVNSIQVGGRNLVTGTEQDIVIDDTPNTQDTGWRFVIIHLTQQPKLGDQITVSAESTLTGKGDLNKYYAVLYNETTTNQRSTSATLIPGKRSKGTLTVNFLGGVGETVLLIYAGMPEQTAGKRNVVHHLKVEFGNQATDWTPAPEDTDKKIDTQTLDSANIDDLRIQGHYFVRNLTGNPIGGWVYVDVTGNNNDRIRQDVYADQNNQHKYRSWNGSRWSDWEQGAYISDVNNVKTEVTASVKNLGDRVTTQVDSITTRMSDQIANAVELIQKSDFSDGSKGSWTVQSIISATNPAPPAELGISGMKVIQSNVRDSYEDVWHSVTPGEKFNVDFWCAPSGVYDSSFGLVFYDANKKLVPNNQWLGVRTDHSGQWRHYTGEITAPGNSAFAKPWFQIDMPADQHNTSWLAKPHIRRQDPRVTEAIKEVNTKWDVANGQIQGKVTETQVNNILNGKGYATQSWAETMFQMKKNSITLQAVRDNITNGIQNQVANVKNDVNQLNNNIRNIGTRNLLHNTSDQWRTLTNDGDWLQQTTASSCWTSTSDYHGGNKFTYAAKITNNSHQQAELEIWLCDQNKNLINGQAFHAPIPKGANAYDVNVTFPITTGTWYIRSWIIFTGGHAPKGDIVQVKEERLVEGATPGSWAPNPDDIQIGGRNLAEKTNQGTINWTCDPGNGATSISEVDINGVRGVRFTQTKKSTSWWVISYALDLNKFKPNTYYTISFDIRTSSDNYNNGGMLNIARGNSGESYLANTNFRTYFKGNQLAHVTCTGRSYGSLSKNGQAFYLNSVGLGSCDWIDVINLKIEVGTKATDWTPAPEDINQQITNTNNRIDTTNSNLNSTNNNLNNVSGQVNGLKEDTIGDLSNICRNPNFRDGSTAGWQGVTASTGNGSSPAKYYGCIQQRDAYYGDWFTVAAGDQYFFSIFAWQDTSPNHFNFGFVYEQTDGHWNWNTSLTFTPTDHLKTKRGSITIPNNVVKARIWVQIDAQSNFGHWYFTNVVAKRNDAISAINITPDQIKIASNKIVIDGNTDIHGDLRTDRVRLVGKQGAIDMTGDTGIKLTNNDGSSMLLGRGNIDLMYKNDFRMNIDSSLMTIMQRNQFTTQKNPIAILNIGSSWNHSNNQIRGADIRYNPGNVNDVNLHGADYLALSYNKPNLTPGEANIKPQLVMAYQDLKFDENHYLWRKGVNVADDLTIQEYQRINVGYRDKEDQSGKWTNDPLMIHRMQWSNSYQADRYQPTIRLGYSKDSMGHAGVTFLWDQVKPFGDRDISDLGSIWFNGQRFVFGWASHKRMFGNQQQPAFMRLDDKGEIMSGIAFTPGSTWDLGSGAWNITASVMNNGG
ncbi:carbohydrate binding domain-containing protein [Limosilactobacillus reuteri]|uniref:carbohydrate binding domain-containing protein n=1 Tax=Limosilactobacillus reuteri TaxID=1598 RepID=UPI003D02E692